MNTMLEEIRERIKDRMAILGVIRDDDEYANGQSVSLAIALRIIDEVEKEHPVPSDIEEAAEKSALTYDMGTCGETYKDGFRDGAGWRKEQMEKKISLIQKSWYEEGKIDGKYEGITDDEKYQQGAFDERERLMKDAVEVRVKTSPLNGPLGISAYCCNFPSEHPFYRCKDGDKVSVIIIKKEK